MAEDWAGESDEAWAENGAWAEHDWSNVPVVPRSDEPPADWDPGTTWLDEIAYVDQGPVAWFDELPPSGRLMCELEGLPPDLVDEDVDAVEMVAHWARLEAHCAAQKRRAAAALSRRSSMAEGLARLEDLKVRTHEPNIAGDELSLRLGIGPRAAQTMVRSGLAFDRIGIPTGDALDAGQIDAAKADLIIAAIEDLPSEAALSVQERVLNKASHLPTGRLRKELAAARAAVEPELFEERCAAAAAKRHVDPPRPLPDGMASLYAVMPAVEAVEVFRAIDAAARSAKTAGDERTLDQLRADALALMGSTAIHEGWIGACPRDHRDATTHEALPNRATAFAPEQCPDVAFAPEQCPDVAFAPEQCPDVAFAPESSLDAVSVSARPSGGLPTSGLSQGRASASDPPSDVGSGSPPVLPPGPGRARSAGRVESVGRAGPVGRVESAGVAEGADPSGRSAAIEAVAPAGPANAPARESTGCGMRVGVIGGQSAHVRVVVPLNSLMGGHGGPGEDLEGADEPAELEGYGPIPASVARALAAGGPWARMVTDPYDRTVLEVSSDKYEPPPAMARLVRAREPECVSTVCGVSSDRCDLHHRIPWPAGPTSVRYLDPDCRRHHLLLTHAGWECTMDHRGLRTWTTPTGLRYIQDRSGNLRLVKPGRYRDLPLRSNDDGSDAPPF